MFVQIIERKGLFGTKQSIDILSEKSELIITKASEQ